MRQIKFRAWDKNSKTMLYVGDNPSWADTTGKLIDSFEDEGLMQFTGLHDKNGKEIYEGDIIYSSHTDRNTVISFGEYHDDAADGDDEPNLTNVGFYIGNMGMIGSTGFGKDIRGQTDCYEVKGNIWENPELLK